MVGRLKWSLNSEASEKQQTISKIRTAKVLIINILAIFFSITQNFLIIDLKPFCQNNYKQ